MPTIAENLPLLVLDLTGRNGGRKEIGSFFFWIMKVSFMLSSIHQLSVTNMLKLLK